MSLIFYYSPQSSASPVHWTLEELGVPYEKVRLDIQKGDTRKPEFLKINPNGKVPVIVHDGVPIFESAAIQIYLGETFGVDKGLFPAPGARRGEAMKWIVWCNVSLGDAVGRFWRNTSDRIPAELRNQKAGEAAKGEIGDLLRMLDEALKGRQYLVEDRFTVADIHLSSWVSYLGMFGTDLSPYQEIGSWMKHCTERPAFKKID